MKKPRLLDLFCGAGGAAAGYHRAGFEVTGVDIAPQPRYPFAFARADALEYVADHGHAYDAIHASPPCQRFTAYGRRSGVIRERHPDLIAATRARLREIGRPYVIENIPGAPLESPVRLCGSSFGLDVRRHRLFEVNWPLLVPPCQHAWQTPRFPAATNRAEHSRCTVEIGVWRIPIDVQRRAMGIDWMELEELSEAIPPAYTQYLGNALLALRDEDAA